MMKRVKEFIGKFSKFSIGTIIAAFAVAGVVSAATTISTNIQTDGTLSVTGTSAFTGLVTLVNASTTQVSASGPTWFTGLSTLGGYISTASSTISSGLFSMNGGASTTQLTASGTSFLSGFVSSASSTINGQLNAQNASTSVFSASGASFLTGLTTFGTGGFVSQAASSTVVGSLAVGNGSTAINNMQFGVCAIASTAVTASSTAYVNCTGAGTIDNTYKVIVQATSSMPTQLVVQSASSTVTAGTINVLFLNTGITGGTTAATQGGLNFWAFK